MSIVDCLIVAAIPIAFAVGWVIGDIRGWNRGRTYGWDHAVRIWQQDTVRRGFASWHVNQNTLEVKHVYHGDSTD